MLPLGDRPLLERTIEQLRAGIREVNLTTHYLPESIVGTSATVRRSGSNPLLRRGRASGHGRRAAAASAPDGPFLVINGDILTGVSYQDMLRFHRKHGAT